jgi:hypothetical protein
MTLMKLTGMSAESAIDCVRAARGSSALGNPIFRQIIHAADRRRLRNTA